MKFPPFFSKLMCLPTKNTHSDLVPFDRFRHIARDVGFGRPSTEITRTFSTEDGFLVNVPSLWFDKHGNPQLLDTPKDVLETAKKYEKQTGMRFPTFGSVESAVKSAEVRSRQGGASKRPLIDLHSAPFQGYPRGKK